MTRPARRFPAPPGVLILIALAACRGTPSLLPASDNPVSPTAPDSFVVAFSTNKGPFSIQAHRAWSPAGVDRFYDLVRRRVYDDTRLYRVVEGFVVQFGLTNFPDANEAWQRLGVPDEAVLQENRRGRVSYARGGPRTRSLQLFINLADNRRLDTLAAGGVVGYPPFGEVIEGMSTVDSLNAEYGNTPAQRQDSIRTLGNAYLDRTFPKLDRIYSARITREWKAKR